METFILHTSSWEYNVGDTNFNKIVLFFGGFETSTTLQFFAPRVRVKIQ